MKDQQSAQATHVNPNAERQSDEQKWLVRRYPNPGIPPPLGFLQLCADRRFHRCLQDQFQRTRGKIHLKIIGYTRMPAEHQRWSARELLDIRRERANYDAVEEWQQKATNHR